jgi:exopolysaccharide biosynthesis protein
VLVRNGKQQRIRSSPDDPYEFSSMLERHPRTAFGWNKQWYFLVQVDGRQRDLSLGMTLEELSAYLVKLGCEEAVNLDGGGSSSLWFEGKVRNNPCDGYERTIANSVLVVRKKAKAESKGSASKSTADRLERSKEYGN